MAGPDTDDTPDHETVETPDHEMGHGRGRGKGRRGKSYGRTAKVGAVWSLMRQGGNELFTLPVTIVLARLLTPFDFGVSAASSFFIALAARLTQFGFGAALIRVKEMRPDHVSSVYVINQAMGIVTFAVLYAFAPLMGAFFRTPEAASLLRVAALAFVISPMGMVSAALIQRRMQFRYTVAADWMDTLVGAVVTIAMAFKGFGYWSTVTGHLTAMVMRVLLQAYLASWTPSLKWSRAAVRELLQFGMGIQSKRLLDYAASHLDNLVVGRMLGMSALGVYTKAFTTMNKVVIRLTLGQAPFRIFSIIHEDRQRFARAYSRLILSITLMAYPALAACIAAAEPLFVVMYGEKWSPAVFPFQVLCLGGMLKLLNAYSSQANEAVGNLWAQVRRQTLGAVLVFVGSIVGAAFGGISGVAVGVLVSWTVLTISLLALVRDATGLTWRAMLAPHLPALTCAVLLAGLIAATETGLRSVGFDPRPWQLLLAQAAVGGLFYVAFVLFGPFAAVREIVAETADDLFPAGPARVVHRFCGTPSRQV